MGSLGGWAWEPGSSWSPGTGNSQTPAPGPAFPPSRSIPSENLRPETIPDAWTPRPLSVPHPHSHCRHSREPGRNSLIRGTGLKNVKDDTPHVRAHRVGHLSRRLARGRGHVASARPRPLRVAKVKRMWQPQPGARSAGGGVQSCLCPPLPGQALRV